MPPTRKSVRTAPADERTARGWAASNSAPYRRRGRRIAPPVRRAARCQATPRGRAAAVISAVVEQRQQLPKHSARALSVNNNKRRLRRFWGQRAERPVLLGEV